MEIPHLSLESELSTETIHENGIVFPDPEFFQDMVDDGVCEWDSYIRKLNCANDDWPELRVSFTKEHRPSISLTDYDFNLVDISWEPGLDFIGDVRIYNAGSEYGWVYELHEYRDDEGRMYDINILFLDQDADGDIDLLDVKPPGYPLLASFIDFFEPVEDISSDSLFGIVPAWEFGSEPGEFDEVDLSLSFWDLINFANSKIPNDFSFLKMRGDVYLPTILK